MAAPKRTKEQREIDLTTLVALLRKAWSKSRIAEHLGVSASQIGYDWKECLRRLSKNRDEDTLALREMYKEQYREIVYQAEQAWDKSWNDYQRLVTEKTEKTVIGGGQGSDRSEENEKTVTLIEGRLPDARYLQVRADCLDKCAELDDAKPPRRIAGPGGDDGDAIPVTIIEVRKIEPEHPAS